MATEQANAGASTVEPRAPPTEPHSDEHKEKVTPNTPWTLDTDGHILGDLFRKKNMKSHTQKIALEKASACTSYAMHMPPWLLAEGADLQIVKNKGTRQPYPDRTYLHALPTR